MLVGRCSSQLSGHKNDERNQKSHNPGFPTSPLSPATTYAVLSKENHMQLTEAATPRRKSGEADGSAVRPSRQQLSWTSQTSPSTGRAEGY
jgi:hypothetical protein